MATTAHTAEPGHKAPFPPFQSETFATQLFWLVIVFVALYLLASRLVLPRVGGIIEARAGKIEGDISEAQRLQAEADAGGDLDWRAQVDSSVVRAHQHAAGARKGG